MNIAFEPLTSQRGLWIPERHNMQIFAYRLKWLVDEVHPETDVIRVALYKLKTHEPTALNETFPLSEALRILKKL